MSATSGLLSLREATAGNTPALDQMVARFHQHEGVSMAAAARRAALDTLLANPAQGRIMLFVTGKPQQICGYAIIAFGFSLEYGGRDAFLDELYIDDGFRGQGMGSAELEQVCEWARQTRLAAVHLEVEKSNTSAKKLYCKLGFEDREHYHLMSLRIAKTAAKPAC